MNPHGNPIFTKGNQLARGNPGGGRRKTDLARMLGRFAPRVVEIIEERLSSPDAFERWNAAKEVMPYLWGKKAAVAVTQGEQPPSLHEYLAWKNGSGDSAPAAPVAAPPSAAPEAESSPEAQP